jgi:hypothetical protein
MVAGMAKDEKTRQALLKRQAKVESRTTDVESDQLLNDAASMGASVDTFTSTALTSQRASSNMSEEEKKERAALQWQDTGVAQGSLLPATAPHHISGSWQPRSMPVVDVEEGPKPDSRWDSSIWSAIGKTAKAVGLAPAETTTAEPVKQSSLVASFMRHSKDLQQHRAAQVSTNLDKDSNLFTAQDAEDAQQEQEQQQAAQDRQEAQHNAAMQAELDDGAEGVLSARGAPADSALSRFMGISPRKQALRARPAASAQKQQLTNSALDSFSFDDAPAADTKKVALAATQTKMSHNLASWLGYDSNEPVQPKHAPAAIQQKKTNANWYMVDLGLEPAQ